jgi:hypothetical protein
MLMRANLAVATVVLLICGWACAPAGDEAAVMAVMDDYRSALLTGDTAALVDLYSEDWRDVHGSTKEDLKEGYEGTTEKGPHGCQSYEDGRSTLHPALICFHGINLLPRFDWIFLERRRHSPIRPR